jgi:hypothetical protein
MNYINELDEVEARLREVEAFRSEFLRYAAMDDLRQPCPIGEMTGDYRFTVGGTLGKRRQTIAEVIGSEMDYGDNLTRAVEILCKLAQGFSPVAEAHALMLEMASSWADKRSDL